MKASDIKRGTVIEVDGASIYITEVHVQTASSRSGNTLYKVRGRNVVTRQKFQGSYKGDDVIQPVDFERRAVQFLFEDADGCTFMDRDNYEQYTLDQDALEEERRYLSDGLEGIVVLLVDGAPVGIELPATVVLQVVECSPALKGASAAARTKPATTSTGLVVQVPEYLAPDDTIKVNTLTGEFISRA